ncbi:endothelin-converting enzyme 1-like, partial [Actinia tenebrosa]|uniref:Endothelin-converting enzyme 1-like n=1 Tax=Actinia tenebrosa TaxID=6105 RepID=A0A6P8IF00_ACTTE
MGRMMNAGSGVRQENKRWSLIHGPRFLAVLLVISMIRVASTQDEMRSNLDQGLNKIRTPGYAKTTSKTNTQSNRVCNTTECIEAAIQINSSMNLAVDPCDDFYEYACGRWPTNNIRPPGFSRYSIYDIAELKSENYKRNKLEGKQIQVNGASNEVQQMPSVLYASCMNLTAIENLDDEPLRERIRELGGWDMSGDWDEAKWDFYETILLMHKKQNEAGPVFSLGVLSFGTNKTSWIYQAGPSLEKEQYLNLSSKKIKAHRELIIDVVTLLGGNVNTTAKKADEIIRLEAQLANVSLTDAEYTPLLKNNRTLEQLQVEIHEFNWTDYMNNMFAPITIPNSEVIGLPTPSYLKKAMKIIQETPKSVLANYMVWYVIRKEISGLSKRFKDLWVKYEKETKGTTSEQDRFRKCIDSTFNSFNDVISAAYIQEYHDRLKSQRTMVSYWTVIQYILHRVQDLRWFISPLKANAAYHILKHSITFTAVILQPPFLYPNKFLRSYNLGKFGLIAGHEVMHGFGSSGRFYDKDGQKRNWWTNNSLQEFSKRSKCYEKQYSEYKIKGKWPINGKNTAEENVADSGGLKIALKAYYNWVERNPSETWRLQGLNHTNEQLFYIGFAQKFCFSATDEHRYDETVSSLYADAKFRVTGSLANSCEFAN